MLHEEELRALAFIAAVVGVYAIGMEGGSAPRVHFSARPEVTVIDVRSVRAP